MDEGNITLDHHGDPRMFHLPDWGWELYRAERERLGI